MTDETETTEVPEVTEPVINEEEVKESFTTTEHVEEPEVVTRPDYVPEAFWDDEKKEVNVEAMAKSEKNFRSIVSKHKMDEPEETDETDTVEAVESPEAYLYQVENEDGELVDAFPDGDILVDEFRNIAHGLNLSQEEFGNAVDRVLQVMSDNQPSQEKEMKKLGKGAQALVDGTATWIHSLVNTGAMSKESANAIWTLAGTADGVRALSVMREMAGEKEIPLDLNLNAVDISDEELYGLVSTEKYMSDPAERVRVDGLFEKRFGKEPSSRPAVQM